MQATEDADIAGTSMLGRMRSLLARTLPLGWLGMSSTNNGGTLAHAESSTEVPAGPAGQAGADTRGPPPATPAPAVAWHATAPTLTDGPMHVDDLVAPRAALSTPRRLLCSPRAHRQPAALTRA